MANLFSRAFRSDPSERIEQLRNDTGRYHYSDCYLLEDGERGAVAGMALFERMVIVSGKELPAGLIGSVSVPPEQRRRGYATGMMTAALEEMHSRNLPFSLLFPYAIPFYNRLGYGVAQHGWLLELPLAELVDFDEVWLVRRLTVEDLPAMQRLYERERFRHNGWFSRTGWEWQERVLDLSRQDDWPHRPEGVVVPGAAGEVRGYLTYTLAPVEDPQGETALTIQEWVSEDDEAWRALAGFVAAQRAQAGFVRYTAPQGFPLHHALKERYTYRNRRHTEFAYRDTLSQGTGALLRLIDPAGAFGRRRYPERLQGECVIGIRDPQLPANEVPLHLHVENGCATVTPAHHGIPTATADVRTWSELYTGALTAREAHLLGHLAADAETVQFLVRLFAAPPWFIHRADWF